MKKTITVLSAALALLLLTVACNPSDAMSSSGTTASGSSASGSSSSTVPGESQTGYRDGTYRGSYVEGGVNQVGVQFTLEDNIIRDISYRSLMYKGVDYLAEDADEATKQVAGQYQQLIDYYIGKDIREGVDLMYTPEEIASDVDAFTSATLRSGKVISAINDALNRDAYALAE